MVDFETIRSAPKVLLHDHLDGGLRPATVIELADEAGYRDLPSVEPAELGRWFRSGADRKSLELYLEGFRHTVAVMQTPEAIARVAAECAQDLADDGVVYAEVRYAPELSTQGGLALEAVMEAWLAGFEQGARLAGEAGRPIVIRAIVTAMRQFARSVEIAELSVRYRDQGVVGFDIAGPEAGFPPSRHLDAFQLIHRANFHVTIHAGEAFGLPSIWEALQWCGAERLGHGVRIVDDITVAPSGEIEIGRLAQFVRDRAGAARDVPHLQRAHRCRGVHPRPPHRPAPAIALPGHGEHRQPAHERREPERRVRGARRRPSASASTRCSGSPRTP